MAEVFELGIPGLLGTLPADLKDALLDAAVAVRFSDGQMIHARGDRTQVLSLIKSGAVRMGHVDAEGSYAGTAILGPGQFFGEFTLFAGLPRRFDAIASGPTVIHELTRTRFERLLDSHRGIREHFLFSLAHRLHAAFEFIDDMRRLPLPVRVAKTLNTMRKAAGASTLTITQSELADLLGVTRASVNKALGTLEEARLVSRAYGRLALPDPGALERWIAERTDAVIPAL